ncbi:MAG: HAD-IB family hydrolase [Actinobacteria bacterium]|nr:HAD-IB family hydrolase [Actinomycetota bacterium]
MARGAVFVDLDRTALVRSSGPVFTAALRAAGLVRGPVPGESALYAVFDRVGENLPSMLLARQGALAVRGVARHELVAAVRTAHDELRTMLRPHLMDALARHREEGRAVVLATTTPHDFVAAFAREIGFHDVVATRHAVGDDGRYSGEIDGPFVWSAGKLRAVEEWCARNGCDLASSWAYTDSWYDEPLLSAVANPRVVNPDARLRALAAARRWPVVVFGPEGEVERPAVASAEVQRAGLRFVAPIASPFARFDIDGIGNVPASGPVILVANHRSYFDPVAIARVVAATGRTVRFLGKKEVFDAPLVGQIASLVGGIRVDRASGSDEPLREAAAALDAGEMVAIMPQGTIPRGRAFFDPVLRGRLGAARLAAMTGATVVPMGLWGTERVWPRSMRTPDPAVLGSPARVQVRIGAPVPLPVADAGDRDAMARATEAIMSAIVALLPAEARERREPTPDDVRRASPPGWTGDPDDAGAEASRRPGTD